MKWHGGELVEQRKLQVRRLRITRRPAKAAEVRCIRYLAQTRAALHHAYSLCPGALPALMSKVSKRRRSPFVNRFLFGSANFLFGSEASRRVRSRVDCLAAV